MSLMRVPLGLSLAILLLSAPLAAETTEGEDLDLALRLAAMLRCPVFFLAGVYEAGNRYRVHAVPLADFSDCPRGERPQRLQAAQQAYVSELEEQCRAAPHNWFNFFDFWKPSPAKRVQTGQGVTAPDAGS